MTIALWCVFVAGLLPYLGTAAAKWGFKNYDNNDPRSWLARQGGVRARGNAAQHNSFEVFPFFAAAVIIASYLKAAPGAVNTIALTFVVARVLYLVCYLADNAALRSVFWFIGLLCVIALFVVAAMA